MSIPDWAWQQAQQLPPIAPPPAPVQPGTHAPPPPGPVAPPPVAFFTPEEQAAAEQAAAQQQQQQPIAPPAPPTLVPNLTPWKQMVTPGSPGGEVDPRTKVRKEYDEKRFGASDEFAAQTIRRGEEAAAAQESAAGTVDTAGAALAGLANKQIEAADRARQVREEIAPRLLAEATDTARYEENPGRWWASRDGGQKMGLMVGLLLGEFGAGMQGRGGQSAAFQMIQTAIDRDIAAQRKTWDAGIQTKETRSRIFNQMMDRYGDPEVATNMAKMAMLESAKLHVESSALRAGGQNTRQTAAALAQTLKDEQLKYLGSTAQRVAATGPGVQYQHPVTGVWMDAKTAAAQSAGVHGQQVDIDKFNAEAMNKGGQGKKVDATSAAEANRVAHEMSDYMAAVSSGQRLVDAMQKHTPTPNENLKRRVAHQIAGSDLGEKIFSDESTATNQARMEFVSLLTKANSGAAVTGEHNKYLQEANRAAQAFIGDGSAKSMLNTLDASAKAAEAKASYMLRVATTDAGRNAAQQAIASANALKASADKIRANLGGAASSPSAANKAPPSIKPGF